ncbi:unnamed protein product [Tuber aestivum]|uniref:Uncharacterized protein n=1 Tax=Tuber aestivum TaxID=59557 RepID=A0A292PTT0_9PEZI|nr:unnamed protein product [Tuber aestivum]
MQGSCPRCGWFFRPPVLVSVPVRYSSTTATIVEAVFGSGDPEGASDLPEGPPLTVSQRLSILKRTIESGQRGLTGWFKRAGTLLFASCTSTRYTYGAKFWVDNTTTTKLEAKP